MWVQDRKRGAVALVCATALSSLTLAGTATAPAAAAESEVAGAFSAVAPSRVLDTREGLGAPAVAVPGGGSVTVTIGGRAGVPTDAAAVVLNVTVTRTSAAGHVTAYPTGSPVPTASNLNFVAGQTLANAVTVKLGTGGRVTLVNGSTRPVHLVADVAGWYAGGTPSEAGTFTAVAPQRLLDTRSGLGAIRRQVAGAGSVTFDVGGRAGVPDDAVAAVLNVTVTRGTSPGHVTAYPAGSEPPLASNLNFATGQTVANAVTVQLGDDGEVTLENGSENPVDLVVDVAGWFLPGEATVGGAFVPVAPTRALDTREEEWYSVYEDEYQVGPLRAGDEAWIDPSWVLETHPDDIGALVLNVTATRGTSAGHVTVYGGDGDVPTASTLNFTPGRTVPNQATVATGEYGQVALVNGSAGSVHLVVDVTGFYLAPYEAPVDVPGATLVSANDAGEVGNSDSDVVYDTTPDGRFVVFGSRATNLGGSFEEDGWEALYLRDTVEGTTTLVTPTVDGWWPDGSFEQAQVSDDGSRVAFLTDGSNLVAGDTNFTTDVFVRDVAAGTTTRVVGSTGRQLDDQVDGFSLSADGTTLAFATAASRVASPQGSSHNVYVRDLATGTTTWVDPGVEEAYEFEPALSGDGRYVAFGSNGALVPEDDNDVDDVYVHDRATGETVLVSTTATGGVGDGASYGIQISEDGGRVVWASDASDLVADDVNPGNDVFARDWRTDGSTELLSGGFDHLGSWLVLDARIDDDASHVVFSILGAYGSNPEEFDTVEAYVQERDGARRDLFAAWPELDTILVVPTADAERLAFTTSTALSSADTNRHATDVYLRDLESDGAGDGPAMRRAPGAVEGLDASDALTGPVH